MNKPYFLLIFNPQHDMALANGDAHFNPPASAIDFSRDCALLPACIAENSFVLCSKYPDTNELSFYRELGLNVIPIVPDELDKTIISNIIPWGWNTAICKYLANLNIDKSLLPDITTLNNIRHFSHRNFARQTLSYLIEQSSVTELFPSPAQMITSIDDIDKYISVNQSIVIKAPFSGSGKGLRWCRNQLSQSDKGWCRHIIEKQGSVLCEKRQLVVQDFAMEFCCNEEVSFVGYSLFKTENGIYKGNLLASDSYIEDKLQKWLTINDLHIIRQLLMSYLSSQLLGIYRGYLGVDMFVYQENNHFKINPVVEINLRMTMGLLARIIHNRFMTSNDLGYMQMYYSPTNGDLLATHRRMQTEYPLHIEYQRIKSGYLSLCPIDENTKYAVTLKVGKDTEHIISTETHHP